jgi:hypothetical protein
VNGRSVLQKGHYFWHSLKSFDLQENGETTLTASARDREGGGTTTAKVFLEEYPLLELDLPEETLFISAGKITISGKVHHPHATVTVNGTAVQVKGKRFSAEADLREGYNLITVVCANGHPRYTRTAFRGVVRSSSSLFLSIDDPLTGTYLRGDTVSLRGTVRGTGTITVRSGNTKGVVEGTVFRLGPFSLAEGENRIVVTATDTAGRSANGEVGLYRDTLPPVILGVSPETGSLHRSSILGVTLEIEDASPVWVSVNGLTAGRNGTTYTRDIPLSDGIRNVEIRATDTAGNVATQVFSVMVDTTPPDAFQVTADPADWTNNTRPAVSFATTDVTSGVAGYEISVDGGVFTEASSPCLLPELEDGIHTVTVKAFDRAGWSTTAETKVYIDTTPPGIPGGFKLVPGNGKIILSWDASDEDTRFYRIVREPAWADGVSRTPASAEGLSYTDPGLENGSVYTYQVFAVDRADNIGLGTAVLAAASGLEKAEYTAEAGAVAEYDGAVLFIPPAGLPQGAAEVRITEAENEEISAKMLYGSVGPIFDFSVADAQGLRTAEGVTLDKEYVAAIGYDENLLPEGFPEENLGVYTYDPFWDRWFLLESSAVDKENNLVYFSSRHFSLYTIQATVAQDLSPEDYAGAGYSPLKSYGTHEGLLVSPQDGGMYTRVTELVIPGPGDYELSIGRRYDTATAKNDAAYFADPKLMPYLRNQGDFAYSMGEGWRLELPYIRNANREMLLCLPNGELYSLWSMSLSRSGSGSGNDRVLELRNRDGEKFTLRVTQRRETIRLRYGGFFEDVKVWRNSGYLLTMKSVRTYEMDGEGRTTKIVDPSGIFETTISYLPGEAKIERIRDKTGRSISFSYRDTEGISYISGFTVNDDSLGRGN